MNESLLDSELVSEIMPDPYFSSIINENGMFGLGDSIHMITLETEYVAPKSKLNDLLKKDCLNLENKKIKSYPIHRNLGDPFLKSLTGSYTEEIDKPCGYERISAHLKCWEVNTLAYASIGIRITGRKYHKRIIGGNWIDDEMNYASVKGVAFFRVNSGGQRTAYGEDSGKNKENVDVTLTWVSGNVLHCDSIWAEYYYDHTNEYFETCQSTYERTWK